MPVMNVSEHAAALGGPQIKPLEPWSQLGWPQSQLGGPQCQLGGLWIQLGWPRSKLGEPLRMLQRWDF